MQTPEANLSTKRKARARERGGLLNLLSALLAAAAQNRCTSLVCSCYVPSRYSDFKGDQDNHHRNRNTKNKKPTNGVMEEDCNNSGSTNANWPHNIDPTPLKSNLKKSTTVELNQTRIATRKVNWPDAHGKDIAHVQEFDPSVSENGELEGIQNSCVCAIQ
ncbi:uncharacterized protein LOC130759672 [Actinidia eriantha]|uniref:uncharacterized protein LOC130759672 n=1 Tax=Actinidia eriantha TaxID=165200 RepID=UPI00258F77BE|nr:uncharacterized protein LOC130759672 [Actinidia eriantha]